MHNAHKTTWLSNYIKLSLLYTNFIAWRHIASGMRTVVWARFLNWTGIAWYQSFWGQSVRRNIIIVIQLFNLQCTELIAHLIYVSSHKSSSLTFSICWPSLEAITPDTVTTLNLCHSCKLTNTGLSNTVSVLGIAVIPALWTLILSKSR